jgi:hypothetical protein
MPDWEMHSRHSATETSLTYGALGFLAGVIVAFGAGSCAAPEPYPPQPLQFEERTR